MFFVERYIVDWGRLPPFFVGRIGVDFLSGCLCTVGDLLGGWGRCVSKTVHRTVFEEGRLGIYCAPRGENSYVFWANVPFVHP